MVDGPSIRAAREKRGWSQSALAEAASSLGAPVSQQAVARLEKGRESKHKLAVLRVLGFLDQASTAGASRPVRQALPREVELAPDAPRFEDLGGRREIEVLGISVGGEDGDFRLNGEVVERVPRPRGLLGRQIFAVRVSGTSMEPRFEEGDLLYVERNREPAIGDDGIFEMKPMDESEAGQAFVKRLVAKGQGSVRVKQWNPPEEFSYRRAEIARMYRVVPRNELLGV